MNTMEVQGILPQRYPFLLVDRILSMEAGRKVKGLKNLTVNEPFFQGHFPGEPIMPAVLIIEAMAQVAGCLAGNDKAIRGYLSAIYKAYFLRPVVPGDQLIIEIEMTQKVKNLIRVKATATVAEIKAARAELGFMIIEE